MINLNTPKRRIVVNFEVDTQGATDLTVDAISLIAHIRTAESSSDMQYSSEMVKLLEMLSTLDPEHSPYKTKEPKRA